MAGPIAGLAVCGAALLTAAAADAPGLAASRFPAPVPAVSEYQFLSASTTPPAETDCFSVGRRCFTPTSMQNSYNLAPLYKLGDEGQGATIAIIDSFGNPNMASDLANFNTQMGLPQMCGEPGQVCGSGIPTFQHVYWNGKTEVKAPPSGSNGTGLQDRNAWALETSLDVEWAHSIAPLANIINVTTNPAETQGVQGFPAMMNAEQFIVDNHQATVITQSFGAVEEGFGSTQSLLNLRHAFVSAAANGVTVLASSGDGGSANSKKTPVKNPTMLPFPTVNWPASDPLVTGVGGTYLCTDPTTGTAVDTVDPPVNCQPPSNAQSNREIGWIDSGGGFSHVFARRYARRPRRRLPGELADRRARVRHRSRRRAERPYLPEREPVQRWLVRRRRNIRLLAAVGGAGRDRRSDRRSRPRADQPDVVRARGRTELQLVLLRRDHRQ
jgi:subtilase family serine protease